MGWYIRWGGNAEKKREGVCLCVGEREKHAGEREKHAGEREKHAGEREKHWGEAWGCVSDLSDGGVSELAHLLGEDLGV